MNGYFELYKPIPLYTMDFVAQLMEYAVTITDEYKKQFYGVLQWVAAALTGSAEHILCPASGRLPVAARRAEMNYKKALEQKDFADAVRWRYIMCAVRDYIRNHREVR